MDGTYTPVLLLQSLYGSAVGRELSELTESRGALWLSCRNISPFHYSGVTAVPGEVDERSASMRQFHGSKLRA